MKRNLLTLAFCLAILAGSVHAQETPALSSLEISLWPEYDRPEVLVILRGSFESTTPLPVQAEISLPAKVGQPTAVAWVDEAGGQFTQDYTTRVEGDWLVVSFELAVPRFQVEYYDTLPVDSTGQRQYTYSYKADYDVGSLTVDFQVPPTAKGFTLEPPADAVVTEEDTLTYHVVDVGSLAQGDERTWTFTYQKDNADLTAATLPQPEASATNVPPATEGTDNSTVLMFLIAFVALVAVGTVSFWLGRRTQPMAQTVPLPARTPRGPTTSGGRPASARRAQAQQRPAAAAGRDTLFCHECGAELRPDSDFCHRCGAKVRRG
jgi:zinc-ribbon domain